MNERKKVFSKENINSSALLNYLFHGNFPGSGKEVWEVVVRASGRIGQLQLNICLMFRIVVRKQSSAGVRPRHGGGRGRGRGSSQPHQECLDSLLSLPWAL